MKRFVIIMTKVPRAGNVKTRLLPVLAPVECATLAEAFLSDTIEKALAVCDSLILAFAPAASGKNYFARFDYENLTLIEQRGADLGERMERAFELAFRRNPIASVVMIGTDSPTFPAEFIGQAFEFLETETADAVLGAADDGGFYLIGLRKFHPRLFEGVEWSSPRVFKQTTRNIERLKINLKLVPTWYDVDAPEDLERLREEISTDERARKTAPETFCWVKMVETRAK